MAWYDDLFPDAAPGSIPGWLRAMLPEPPSVPIPPAQSGAGMQMLQQGMQAPVAQSPFATPDYLGAPPSMGMPPRPQMAPSAPQPPAQPASPGMPPWLAGPLNSFNALNRQSSQTPQRLFGALQQGVNSAAYPQQPQAPAQPGSYRPPSMIAKDVAEPVPPGGMPNAQPGPLPTERLGYPPGTSWHMRQNNPGNVRMTPDSLKAYPGAKPGERGFLAFDTPEQGLSAIGQTFRHIAQTTGATTLRGIISKYAPKGDGANDPNAYANFVAKQTGIDPDAKIDVNDPAVMGRIIPAIVKMETGVTNPSYTPEMYSTAAGPSSGRNVAPAATPAAMMGYRPPTANIPEPGPMAPEEPPSWFARNKEFIGDLGGTLSAMGQGLSQAPPGAGWWTGLNLGASNASHYAQTLGDRKLNEKLKRAQVGEVEAKAENRRNMLELAKTVKDPIAAYYLKLGSAEKAVERLEKIDPNEAVRVAREAALKTAATERAKLAPDIVAAEAEKAGRVEEAKNAVKPPEQWQAQASSYAHRMTESNKTLSALTAKGYTSPTLATWMATDTPFESFQGTPQDQEFMRAAREWISGKLRKESGAVVNETEFRRDFRTFFPMPGDTPEVRAQKESARKRIEDEMRAQGGNSYARMFPPSTTSAAPTQGWQNMGDGWKVRVR